MADWSVVAAAAVGAVSGVAGASLGYLGARLQTRGERERLAAEQGETRRQKRDEIYWTFLDCERRFSSMMALDRRISREEFDSWNVEFDHLLNGVVLFGTLEVSDAVERLAEVAVRDASHAFLEDTTDDPFEEKAHRAYLNVLPQVREARSALKAAMRQDIGAPSHAQTELRLPD